MAHKNTDLQNKIVSHWEAFDAFDLEEGSHKDIQHVKNAYQGLGELFQQKDKESDVGFLTDLPQICLDISQAMRMANIVPPERSVLSFIQSGYDYLSAHQQQLYDINSHYYDQGQNGRRLHNDYSYFYADAAEYLSFFSPSYQSRELCSAFMLNSKDTWHKDTSKEIEKKTRDKNIDLNITHATLMLKNAQQVGGGEMSYHNEKGGVILTAEKCIIRDFSAEKQQLVTTIYKMNKSNSFAVVTSRGKRDMPHYTYKNSLKR